jgi:hypothetical protein
MKRLSLYLFLILFTLPTPSQADDIRDFQIEGMSVGDSLLDYFSKKEIKDNTKPHYYKYMINFAFVAIEFYQHPSFKDYSGVQLHVKKNDKKYKIYSISGYDYYDNDIKGCYKKLNEIDKELSVLFKDAERRMMNTKHRADESGKSTVKQIYYTLESGDGAVINCYDWSKKMTEKNSWYDNLDVSLDRKEFQDAFIIEDPY